MRGKLIVALAMVILCFALSDIRAETAVSGGRAQNIEFAGAGDIEDNSFYGVATLNLLVGGVAITFSGWLLGRRKPS